MSLNSDIRNIPDILALRQRTQRSAYSCLPIPFLEKRSGHRDLKFNNENSLGLLLLCRKIVQFNIDSIRAGRSGVRIPVAARFSAPVQTGPAGQPSSYTMGTGSFPGVKRSERGVDHPHHLAPRSLLIYSEKCRHISLYSEEYSLYFALF